MIVRQEFVSTLRKIPTPSGASATNPDSSCGRADGVGGVYSAQLSGVAVNVPTVFHRPYCSQTPLKLCGFDGYDNLLLPGHRFLAQIQVFVSGEHLDDGRRWLRTYFEILRVSFGRKKL